MANRHEYTTDAAMSIVIPNSLPKRWQDSTADRSLTASVSRVTAGRRRDSQLSSAGGWRSEAWSMFDQVGELHYVLSTIASRASQADMRVVRDTGDGSEEDQFEGAPFDVLGSLRAAGLPRIVMALATNLLVAGEGYLLGYPERGAESRSGEVDLDSLEWIVLSSLDFRTKSGSVDVPGVGWVALDDCFALRVYRPHPGRYSDTDSPVRAALPVLREIVGLSLYVSAQVDSRLAGAGILVIPESADRAMRAQQGSMAGDGSPFVEALMDAMLTPIADRSSSSSVVPITISVPDESVSEFRHMSFASPIDGEVRALRAESIERLALSLDVPPEVLTGSGSMSHWGAWQLQEEVVTTHLWPVLSVIADALTAGLLRPALESVPGVDPDEFRVEFNVDELTAPGDKTDMLLDLFDRGVISAEVLRGELGFSEDEAGSGVPIRVSGVSVNPRVGNRGVPEAGR